MRLRFCGVVAAALLVVAASRAAATPEFVIDVATGNVLFENDADREWYPASLTKLMTVYVALSAVRDHRISLDTPLVVSRRAASMPPSRMGFKPGTEVTLGNALKMLMVKSPNDIAITIAEGVAGSVDAFADDMNATAAQLGMRESHFVNPNGLHNPDHYSSAHDLGILARAIYLTFPQYADLFNIGAIRVGDQTIPNHNNMLGRYPGVDGMKTGFTCAAGFNLVASATRDGHHYVAVVLGAPNVKTRLTRTAVLLDRAFDGVDRPEPPAADASPSGRPQDMHNLVCRRRSHAVAAFQAETDRLEAPLLTIGQKAPSPFGVFSAAALAQETPAALRIALTPEPVFDPVTLSIGPNPGYNGPIAGPRPPHSPVGTPLSVDVAPVAQASSNEPNEDTQDASDNHAASRAQDVGDAAVPQPTKVEKHHKAIKAARHKMAKTAHGKHKAAKAEKAVKAKPASHKAKGKPAKAGKVKVKAGKIKAGKASTKSLSKTHAKHKASSDD